MSNTLKALQNQLDKYHVDTPTINHTQSNDSVSNTNTPTSYNGTCGRVVSKFDKVIAKWLEATK